MRRFQTFGRACACATGFILAGAIALVPMPAQAGMDLEIDLGATQAALSSSGQPWALGPNAGLGVRVAMGNRWSLRFGVDWRRLWDDTRSDNSIKLPHPDHSAMHAWTRAALSLLVLRTIGGPRWSPYLAGGLGWSSWRVEQYPGYNPISVDNGDGVLVDYQADEVICTFLGGVAPRLLGTTRLRMQLGLDLFTGLGADFAREVNEERSRAQITLAIGLSIPLEAGSSRQHAARNPAASQSGAAAAHDLAPGSAPSAVKPGDADGDGVADVFDSCPDTPTGAVVDRAGCPLDADGDGVFDGLDRCPGTLFADRRLVDSTGCLPASLSATSTTPVPPDSVSQPPAIPVDTALSVSPAPPMPTHVVIDADSDGVADTLDHCPDTPKGMEVDSTGCLVMTRLDRRLVLRVAYISGGTELDPLSIRIMKDLAVRLRAAPDMLATIEGFTDDIGEAEANLRLSQKRADKAKAYLVSLGVAAKRITAIGKGETSPIADNATALGRRTNRRLEISFK